jgi:hypothetical protein
VQIRAFPKVAHANVVSTPIRTIARMQRLMQIPDVVHDEAQRLAPHL